MTHPISRFIARVLAAALRSRRPGKHSGAYLANTRAAAPPPAPTFPAPPLPALPEWRRDAQTLRRVMAGLERLER